MSDPSINSAIPVLLELRRTLHDARRAAQWSDPADWRCSQAMNLVRAYALLVRTASTELLCSAGCEGNATSGTRWFGNRDTAAETLRLLQAFPRAIARNQVLALDQGLSKALNQVECRLNEELGGEVEDGAGAFLGEDWRTPLPPTFQGILVSMGSPSTTQERSAALSKIMAGAPAGPAADYLDEANYGIASITHLAQTFDDCSAPEEPVSLDRRYLRATMIRAMAMHRLLLELVGVRDRIAICALIGLAEQIASQPTFVSCFRPDIEAQRFLDSSRATAIAVLEGAGKVSLAQKPDHVRAIVRASEKEVLTALRSALASSG